MKKSLATVIILCIMDVLIQIGNGITNDMTNKAILGAVCGALGTTIGHKVIDFLSKDGDSNGNNNDKSMD